MYINGIAQEEEAVTSLLQLQESLLFLIRNLHQHLVGSIDDLFIRHISSCQLMAQRPPSNIMKVL